MIRNAFGLAQDGKVNKRGMPNLLQLAVFAREFTDVMQFTRPPRIVQRILFGLLSPQKERASQMPSRNRRGVGEQLMPLQKRQLNDPEISILPCYSPVRCR
jgi:hypothetical protein